MQSRDWTHNKGNTRKEGLIKTGGSNRVKGKIWGKNKGGNLVSKCHIFVHKWLCVNSFSMQVL